jgi:Disulfide bond chaperones of the HSP33 family
MASAIDSSDLVFTAQSLHGLTKTTGAALGRLLTGASIMGAMLKGVDSRITLIVQGDGPTGALVARSDAKGNTRGYVEHPKVDLPLRPDKKINVGEAVGGEGRLTVIRDPGQGEPYVAHVPLVSGEIAEDLTAYYAHSEQIPTVFALGVLTDPHDGKVLLAGGMLIQVLPGADDEIITKLEENVAVLPPVTTMLAQGMTALEMCRKALDGFQVEVLDSFPVNYVCDCSKERFGEMLKTMPPEEIRTLPLDEKGNAELVCHYCSRKYYYNQEELDQIALQVEEGRKS